MIADQKAIPLSATPPMRRRLLHGLHKALHWSGAAALYTHLGSVAGATILMYHSVSGPDQREWIDPANAIAPDRFEAQMRFLREHRKVISMTSLVQSLREGVQIPAGTVAITFDDGYLDNLLIAAPILARLELPATLYLPTGYIQRQQNQWIDDLYSIFRRRQRHEVSIDGQLFKLEQPEATRTAYSSIATRLRSSTFHQRDKILSDVRGQVQPDAMPPRLTMSWGQVRELKTKYPLFELGVHTVDHIDLSEHAQASQSEIEKSIEDVERETGTHPRHFSYPYGRCSESARQAVIASGLESAVVGGAQVLINKAADRFSLPRLAAPDSTALIGFWTSGAYPALSKALFGRA